MGSAYDLPLIFSSQVVDTDSEEAKIIRQYVKNTHAETHNAYDLEVVDVSYADTFSVNICVLQ